MNTRPLFHLARRDWIILAALALLAIILRVLPGVRIIDDAYITYRYARNLIDGVGFVYNPGEPVLGTTTPLYTLIMALLGWLFGSDAMPQASAILNALADGASAALLYRVARRLLNHDLPGIVLGALWAVAPRSVTFAIGGMETSVYVLLLLGAFAAWLDGRNALTAILMGLGTLMRPDALIWAGLLGLAMIAGAWASRTQRPPVRRLPWLEGAIYFGILLPWIIFGALTYGSPMTNSVAAKDAAYQVEPTASLLMFFAYYGIPFFESETLGVTGALFGAILYPLLAIIGGVALARADRRTLPVVLFPWLYFVTFAVANPPFFHWYMVPPTPIYLLCILAGVWAIVGRLAGMESRRWALAAAGFLWAIFSLRAWTLHPGHGPDRPAPKMAQIDLELTYAQAAESVKPWVDADTVVAVGDIGVVGWITGARILDTVGLVSPEASAYYPLPVSMLATRNYAVAPDLILDFQPDYLIILEAYGRNSLHRDPRFLEAYRLRQKIDSDIYGSDGMLIYERVR